MSWLRPWQSRLAVRLTPVRRYLEDWANLPWYDQPFGSSPQGSAEHYLSLAEEVQRQQYPEIEQFEQQVGLNPGCLVERIGSANTGCDQTLSALLCSWKSSLFNLVQLSKTSFLQLYHAANNDLGDGNSQRVLGTLYGEGAPRSTSSWCDPDL